MSAQGNQEAWSRVQDRLRAEVGDDVYDSWFARMEVEALEEGVARLSVPTRFLKSWISSHYAERVLACWQAHNSSVAKIELIVRSCVLRHVHTARHGPRPDAANGERYAGHGLPLVPANRGHQPNGNTAHELLEGSPLDPRLTFGTFVVGRSNSLVHAAATQIASAKRGEKPMFNPLYIHAGVGLGKTHLLQAIAWGGRATGERKVLYLTADTFRSDFVSAWRASTGLAFKEALRGIGILVIDGLQLLQGKSTQAEFCLMLNEVIGNRRQVVLGCDRPPHELMYLSDDLRLHLARGLVVEMGTLDEELRLGILRARAAAVKALSPTLDVPPPVLAYIARTVAYNGRSLEGALNRVLAHHKLTGEPVTLEMAQREVLDLIRPQDPKRVRIEDIQRIVARQYNVSRMDILSERRTAGVMRPRQVAMYLAKTLTQRSLPEIGRHFGDRDHTTVLYAVRKIEWLIGIRNGEPPPHVRYDHDTPIDHALAAEIEALKREVCEAHI